METSGTEMEPGGSGGTSQEGPEATGGSAGSRDAGRLDAGSADGPGQQAKPDAASPTDARDLARDGAPPDLDASDPDATNDRADAGPTPPGSYNPCPPRGSPCRVMPLGDSISGHYREQLFRRVIAAKQSVLFVGSQESGPATVDGVPFPRGYEGYPGYTIPRISATITMNDTIRTYKPDIVLLEAGTNGGIRTSEDAVPRTIRDLERIIDQILALDPHLLLAVAQITPMQNDEATARVARFNAAIPGLVSQRAAAGKHIIVVDAFGPFVANPRYQTELMKDIVHPNAAGYVLLGNIWYGAIGPLLRSSSYSP